MSTKATVADQEVSTQRHAPDVSAPGLVWSAPYCGVQHLVGQRYVATVEDHGTYANAVFYRRPSRYSEWDSRDFDTAAQAREWCEAQFRSLPQPTSADSADVAAQKSVPADKGA